MKIFPKAISFLAVVVAAVVADDPQAVMEHLTSASADDAMPSVAESSIAITSDAIDSEDEGVTETSNHLRGSLPFLGDEDEVGCQWGFNNCLGRGCACPGTFTNSRGRTVEKNCCIPYLCNSGTCGQ